MKERLKNVYKANKKAFLLSAISFLTILVFIVGTTYAFFMGQNAGRTELDTRVTTGTMDRLSFSINKNIEVKAGLYNFKENEGDKYDDATATIMLSPNSETGTASNKYNLFLVIDQNEFVYTTEEEIPEVVIKVTDPSGNVVESIGGLKGKDGVFDITTKRGAISIAADYPIAATNNTTTSQSWKVELRLINLDSNQNINQGKNLNATLYLTKEDMNEYQLPEVNGLMVNTTNDSITASLNMNNGTEDVDKYYFAIDSNDTTGYLPVTESVTRLANNKVFESKAVRLANTSNLTYLEQEENSYTFTGLEENKQYGIYAYAVNKNGFSSNIYGTRVRTNGVILPRISGSDTYATSNSIEINVTSVAGTNEIAEYKYSIDNGATWNTSTNTRYTFTGLKDTREYVIKAKAIDSEGNESTEYYERVETESYKVPAIRKVDVTTTESTIALTVDGQKGTNNISKYQYSIDDGSTWEDGTYSKTYTGLTKDQEYTIKVKAIDTEGYSSNTYEVTAKATDYVLPKVNNIDVRTFAKKIEISVDAQGGTNSIDKYYYSIQDGRNYEESESSNKEYNELTSNTVFYIKVYVTDTEGASSTVFTRTVKTEYVNPSIKGISKSEEANGVTLVVDAEKGSNEIDKYYYRLKGSNTWLTNNNGTINITGLLSDTDYTYEVMIKDTASHESRISEVTVHTSYVNPTANSIEVVSRTWDSITVRMNTTKGSHEIGKYYFKTNLSTYMEANTNEYTFTGLNDGRNTAIEYTITGYVVDEEYVSGDQGKSNIVNVETSTLAYTLPQVSATHTVTDSSITMNATATEGSGAIATYSYSSDNGESWTDVTSSSLTNEYTFTGLNDYTDYDVIVKVTDVNGRSKEYSETIKTAYKVPSVTIAENHNWESITLNLTGIAGTNNVSKYYYCEGDNTTCSASGATWVEGTSSKTYSGLTKSTVYTYSVKVSDTNNTESDIVTTTVTTSDYNEPTVSIEASTTYNSVTINATGAATGTNASIASYQFIIDEGTPVVKTTSEATSSHTFSVSENATHSVKVIITDSNGRTGEASSSNIATPAYVTPSVTSVTKTSSTIDSITISIEASDGQNTIKGYKVSTDDGATYGSLISTTDHTYSYTITGLSDNTSYPVKVISVDTLDRESSGVGSSMMTSYKEPTVTLASTSKTWNSVTLQATATKGSTNISQYRFQKGSEGWSSWQTSASYTFSSLDPSTQYTFSVEVKDSATTPHTANNTATVTTNAYTAVNLSSVTAGNIGKDSATLTANATAGTGSISTYEYKLSTASSYTSNGASNVINLSNLSMGTSYTYNVRVKDSNNKYSNVYDVTFTTSSSDLSLTVSNLPTTVGKVVTPSCTGASATWNKEYQRLEIASYSAASANCTLSFVSASGTTPLNTYITSLNNTTQGDGKVVSENGYRYEGKNPNNYIMFNNELWRIIGVFDSSSHGQSGKNLVKIIRNESIGGLAWNKAGTNDWVNSSLKALLNGAYYNHEVDTTNCYGSSSVTSTCDYTVKGIQSGYQGMIENVTWYLGGGGKKYGYTTYTPDSVYGYERNSAAVYSGRSASTTGKIGLMYESDYLYGVQALDCARTTAHGSYITASCAGKDWLYGSGNEWTISPLSFSVYHAWNVAASGHVGSDLASNGSAVRPVLYLSSSVYKVSGTGTITDPYIIG